MGARKTFEDLWPGELVMQFEYYRLDESLTRADISKLLGRSIASMNGFSYRQGYGPRPRTRPYCVRYQQQLDRQGADRPATESKGSGYVYSIGRGPTLPPLSSLTEPIWMPTGT